MQSKQNDVSDVSEHGELSGGEGITGYRKRLCLRGGPLHVHKWVDISQGAVYEKEGKSVI